jgi:2-methylcitrate dehydratase PrpD
MRCSIKPHASCRSTHATVDAVLALMREHPGLAQRTRKIEVRASRFVTAMCDGRDLSTLASAQMSMPYAVASAWTFGDASLERYLEPVRRDPSVVAAMDRVEVAADPSLADLEEPTVTVHADGMTPLSAHVAVALGAPANPLSDETLLAKFHALAAVAIDETSACALAERVMSMDDVDDMTSVLSLLEGRTGGRLEGRPDIR